MDKGDYSGDENLFKGIFNCCKCGWVGVLLSNNQHLTTENGKRKHNKQRPECDNPKIELKESFEVDSEDADLYKEDSDISFC